MVHTINQRIEKLDSLLDAGSYTKQKCILKTEPSIFFCTLDPLKTLQMPLLRISGNILCLKKRVEEHNYILTLESSETRGLQERSCPKTLTAKSVDSLLGKIRAIFRDRGGQEKGIIFYTLAILIPLTF